MAGVFGAAAIFLCCLLLAAAPGRADPASAAAPAPLGLMQPFEINKIVRDAGFTPLGLPQREGTTYVLRAIDSRDILMRVVIDARSGAISAVNRFVPARPDGVIGMMPPDGAQGPLRSPPGPPPPEPLPPPRKASPYEPLPGPPPGSPPHDVPQDHAKPADIGGPPAGPKEANVSIPLSPLTAPADTHPVPQGAQPLPRPRPSNLMQKAKPPGKVPKEPAAKPSAAPAAASVAPAAPRRAPTTPKGVPQIAAPD